MPSSSLASRGPCWPDLGVRWTGCRTPLPQQLHQRARPRLEHRGLRTGGHIIRGQGIHRSLSALLVAAAFIGCGDSTGPADQRTFEFDFASEAQGWEAGFSDYPVGAEDQVEPESAHEPLPAEIDREGNGLYIAATNTPDDLFMFWKRQVTGLAANARYRVTLEVEFATEVPTGCVGIGGSPGESVFVKAGATAIEPVPEAEDVSGIDYYQMNIDKGEQAQGGEDAVVLGNIANTNTDCENPEWELKTLTQDNALEMTTASDGSAWLIVGTESGFEGRTELFYTRIAAEFERV